MNQNSKKEIPMSKRFFPVLILSIGYKKYEQVKSRYRELFTHYDFPNNSILQRHLIDGILPGLALYQIFRESGESQVDAIAAIDRTFEKLFSDKRTSMKKFGGIPFFYGILRLYIKPAMLQYPADGWKIDWLQNDRNAIRFNMTCCFYFDTLSRYGAPELTLSFCKVDDFIFGEMSPQVSWQRLKTIGKGDHICDFCFVHQKKGRNNEPLFRKRMGF